MSGGLIQLAAYGSQDIYLTGEPQITFWKGVYRRHTNFAMETIENSFSGTPDFGSTSTCIVSRNADLLSSAYLELTLPDITSFKESDGVTTLTYCTNVGHKFINQVEIHVGGQMIDRHYGLWMDIWDELTTKDEKKTGYNEMTGKGTAPANDGTAILHIPLQFWFCRHPGSAIPLVALQYHEVKLLFTFSELSEVVSDGSVSGLTGSATCKVFCRYVYLDTEERSNFGDSIQEYLIEQVQHVEHTGLSAGANSSSFSFNHPVKELVWVIRNSSDITNADGSKFFNYIPSSGSHWLDDSVDSETQILFNGQGRSEARPASYYNLVQPYQFHTRVPDDLGIYVYSFCLRPEEHQPSGSVNFSRIDNATIVHDIDATAAATLATGETLQANLFGVNYNVFRVEAGLGGLAYSN